MFSTNSTWLPGQRSHSKVIHHDVTERNWLLGAVNQFKLCVCVDVWEPLLGWNRDTGNWQYDAVWTAVSAQTGSTSQVVVVSKFLLRALRHRAMFTVYESLFESLDPFLKFCASTCFVLRSSVCVRVSNFFIYCLSWYRLVQIWPMLKFHFFSDLYCTLEVDSFGYFVSKAKTRVFRDTTEPHWNEVIVFLRSVRFFFL